MIPEHAKKVFSGILFDIYQWEQTLYDGSTTTFERAVRRAGGAQVIAVTKDHSILLCEQSQPDSETVYPSLPGGRLNPGEDHLTAAKRELLEETGFTSTDFKEFLRTPQFGHVLIDRRIFIARDAERTHEPNIDAGGERISCRLLSFEAFLELGRDPRFYDELLKPVLLEAFYNPISKQALADQLGIPLATS